MFAVIYRSYLIKGKEEQYQMLWKSIATYFVENRGAIGSCLHKTDEGYWLAYSRWPDKETRDLSWPKDIDPSNDLPDSVRQAIINIKNCIDKDRDFPEICMDVIDDMLLN